ncbi:MAG: ATP-binding cassette domain-containing protein [Clostridium sp.]|jgi:ABC-2 type transport system ATP-binding protein|nr:ATP-binding cassette domain-containing protein [Clostridium sp.]
MAVIQVRDLQKNYDYYEKELGLKHSVRNVFHRKKLVKEAVKGISLDVEEGEIVGFIGPNGAGKTTTLKMLSGILHPSSGTALVNGYVPWERKKGYKMNMSIVMGQKAQLNWDLPANESLYLNKCIYEVEDREYQKTLDELVELLEVGDLLKVQVRRLSLGERMKMELIASFLHRPKVVFLDEPTIGLDFLSQKSIREFIRSYNRQNKVTILLTSHYLNDIESLCKRTIIIHHGSLLYDGDLSGLNGQLTQKKILKLQFSQRVSGETLGAYGTVVKNDGFRGVLEIEKHKMKGQAQRILQDLPVTDINIEDTPIEAAISELFRKGEERL